MGTVGVVIKNDIFSMIEEVIKDSNSIISITEKQELLKSLRIEDSRLDLLSIDDFDELFNKQKAINRKINEMLALEKEYEFLKSNLLPILMGCSLATKNPNIFTDPSSETDLVSDYPYVDEDDLVDYDSVEDILVNSKEPIENDTDVSVIPENIEIDFSIQNVGLRKLKNSDFYVKSSLIVKTKEELLLSRKYKKSNWGKESRDTISIAALIILEELDSITRSDYIDLQKTVDFAYLPNASCICKKFSTWSNFKRYLGLTKVKNELNYLKNSKPDEVTSTRLSTNKKTVIPKQKDIKTKLNNSNFQIYSKYYNTKSVAYFMSEHTKHGISWSKETKDFLTQASIPILNELSNMSYDSYNNLQKEKYPNYLSISTIKKVLNGWSDFKNTIGVEEIIPLVDADYDYLGILNDIDVNDKEIHLIRKPNIFIYKKYSKLVSIADILALHTKSCRNWSDENKDFICLATVPIFEKIIGINTKSDYQTAHNSVNKLPNYNDLVGAFGSYIEFKNHIGLSVKPIEDVDNYESWLSKSIYNLKITFGLPKQISNSASVKEAFILRDVGLKKILSYDTATDYYNWKELHSATESLVLLVNEMIVHKTFDQTIFKKSYLNEEWYLKAFNSWESIKEILGLTIK